MIIEKRRSKNEDQNYAEREDGDWKYQDKKIKKYVKIEDTHIENTETKRYVDRREETKGRNEREETKGKRRN